VKASELTARAAGLRAALADQSAGAPVLGVMLVKGKMVAAEVGFTPAPGGDERTRVRAGLAWWYAKVADLVAASGNAQAMDRAAADLASVERL
jgi:hypothetical protein